jgi:CubicO group peptidase (beta-lactamase class C family)
MGFGRRVFLQAAVAAPALAKVRAVGTPSVVFVRELQTLMRSAPVPGALIGVVRDFRVVSLTGLGERERGSGQAITSDTLFQAASLTKQVTAYAAFVLRERGKLDFDRTLVSYVDDLRDAAARTVTIRHVLSHSSGFVNWRWAEEAKNIPDLTPASAPGSKFQYSGEGFFYLQRILEEVTRKGFGELIAELVFEPLGMHSSTLVLDPNRIGQLAVPHDRRGEVRKEFDKSGRALRALANSKSTTVERMRYSEYAQRLPNNTVPNGAASLVTSGADYGRFVCAAIRNAEIAQQQVSINEFLGWGLGWATEHYAARTYVWQWGDNPGYKNFVIAEPAGGNAVFVFTNGDAGARVYDRAVVHLTGHDHPALFWL